MADLRPKHVYHFSLATTLPWLGVSLVLILIALHWLRHDAGSGLLAFVQLLMATIAAILILSTFGTAEPWMLRTAWIALAPASIACVCNLPLSKLPH